jgi:hypothetical protein
VYQQHIARQVDLKEEKKEKMLEVSAQIFPSTLNSSTNIGGREGGVL